MIYLFFFFGVVFGLSLHEPQTIFSHNETTFTDSDFYEEVFRDDWDGYSLTKKRSVFHDILKKELSFLAATQTGLTLHPSIEEQLQTRYSGLLINNTYEHLIARPLIDLNVVKKNIENLLYKVEAHHILIGFSGSVQNTDAVISKTEAKVLADSLFFLLQKEPLDSIVSVFGQYAKDYSIDPSVEKNNGFLGWVPWGRTVMSFQEPLFKLETNVVSKPILTEYGYHLILKTNSAYSSHYYYNIKHYKDLAYKVAQNTLSFDVLKQNALKHDSLLFIEKDFLLYDKNIDSLYVFIKQKQQGQASGNKNMLLGWLRETQNFGLLFVVQNKGFGLKWFINKLEQTPASRIPPINNKNDLIVSIKSLLLQDLVLEKGFYNNIDTTVSFKRDLLNNYKNILYNEYVTSLLNSLPAPDTLEVLVLYNDGVFNKDYVKPLRVVFSEIRVFDEIVAAEIIQKIDFGLNFDSLLVEYGGSIKEPVSKGKNTPLSDVGFNLKVGELSDIVNNKNGSFSIIRVERFLQEEPFSLDLVYSQIERKIITKKQAEIKENLLDYLINLLGVNINYKVLGL